jgi:hypothetical protein
MSHHPQALTTLLGELCVARHRDEVLDLCRRYGGGDRPEIRPILDLIRVVDREASAGRYVLAARAAIAANAAVCHRLAGVQPSLQSNVRAVIAGLAGPHLFGADR